MKSSRRDFLKVAGVAALGASTVPALDVFAAGGGPVEPQATIKAGEKSLSAKQWAMVVDTTKIHSEEDLEPMLEICHKIHNVPDLPIDRHEIKWIWPEEFHHAFTGMNSQFLADKIHHTPFPVLCNHCENPPCVRACPTQATFKRDDGIVIMDFHRCIGCRFCMAACPFGARSFNFIDPEPHIEEVNLKFPRRSKGVVEKCNFCAERLAVGEIPACVEVSNGILAFGDLYDAESDVRKLIAEKTTIRRKTHLGTDPAVYYIV